MLKLVKTLNKLYLSYIVFFLMAYSCSNNSSREANTVERLYIHENLNIPYIEDTDRNKYILDTGAEASLLFDTTLFEEGFFSNIGLNRVKINGQKKPNPTGINKKITFKTFALEGERFIYVSNYGLLSSDSTIKGLIGMDILSKSNSYWNIPKGEFIINYDSATIEEPQLTLKYKKSNLPITNIEINTIPVENILLDTGHSLAVILPQNYMSKYGLESIDLLEGETINFYSTQTNSVYYITDTLKINNYVLQYKQPISFAFSDFNRGTAILGFPFFTYWDYFAIDVSTKKIHFYKAQGI